MERTARVHRHSARAALSFALSPSLYFLPSLSLLPLRLRPFQGCGVRALTLVSPLSLSPSLSLSLLPSLSFPPSLFVRLSLRLSLSLCLPAQHRLPSVSVCCLLCFLRQRSRLALCAVLGSTPGAGGAAKGRRCVPRGGGAVRDVEVHDKVAQRRFKKNRHVVAPLFQKVMWPAPSSPMPSPPSPSPPSHPDALAPR